jgi:type 1 glutamine amidotransferase
MILKTLLRDILALLAAALILPAFARAEDPKPLRALYVTGGCCHDYTKQKVIIPEGVSARAKVEWTIVHEGGTSQDHRLSVFENPDWAKNFDVVVHNECFSQISDKDFIERVIAPIRNGTPLVIIHCAMHTFRDLKTDEWRECIGVTTRAHGPQQPLDVKNLKPTHPIMIGFPEVWKTGKEELYAILKVWPNTTPLAQAYALDNKKDHPVIWTNTFGKGRVFGTTIAHNNQTMSDPVYLDMLTRGLLWACDKLDDNGMAKPGYGVSSAAK